jgi:hypothetical protein
MTPPLGIILAKRDSEPPVVRRAIWRNEYSIPRLGSEKRLKEMYRKYTRKEGERTK